MRKKIKVYLLICLLLFITGTTGCSNSDNNDITAFFPTTVGSNWYFAGSGNEFAEFNQSVSYKLDNQVQFDIVNPGTSAKAIYTISKDTITRIFLEHESYEDENLLEMGFEANDNTIILKTPLKEGTAWEFPGGTREIVEVNANIITPAGNFTDCIKIKCQYDDSESINYEYYQRNVGLVKKEFIDNEFKVTSSLKEYTIK